jgi:hypothetical protein
LRPLDESNVEIFELGRLRRGDPTFWMEKRDFENSNLNKFLPLRSLCDLCGSALKNETPTAISISSLLAPYPMHDLPFRFPLDLKIGFGVVKRIFVPGKDFEEAAGVDLFAGVFKIFLVIGHEE